MASHKREELMNAPPWLGQEGYEEATQRWFNHHELALLMQQALQDDSKEEEDIDDGAKGIAGNDSVYHVGGSEEIGRFHQERKRNVTPFVESQQLGTIVELDEYSYSELKMTRLPVSPAESDILQSANGKKLPVQDSEHLQSQLPTSGLGQVEDSKHDQIKNKLFTEDATKLASGTVRSPSNGSSSPQVSKYVDPLSSEQDRTLHFNRQQMLQEQVMRGPISNDEFNKEMREIDDFWNGTCKPVIDLEMSDNLSESNGFGIFRISDIHDGYHRTQKVETEEEKALREAEEMSKSAKEHHMKEVAADEEIRRHLDALITEIQTNEQKKMSVKIEMVLRNFFVRAKGKSPGGMYDDRYIVTPLFLHGDSPVDYMVSLGLQKYWYFRRFEHDSHCPTWVLDCIRALLDASAVEGPDSLVDSSVVDWPGTAYF